MTVHYATLHRDQFLPFLASAARGRSADTQPPKAATGASIRPHAGPRRERVHSDIEVPIGFLVGADSPLPLELSTRATPERISSAWVEVVEGAGHFPLARLAALNNRLIDDLDHYLKG